jgi:type IV pilus assembly protein PilY1
MEKYQSIPFISAGAMVPHVLIVLSKHIQMFQHGYPGLRDMDGDGRVDTGFNPAVTYVGLFDSYSCYEYVGAVYKAPPSGYNYAGGDANGYFRRTGPTMEDLQQESINQKRPAGLPEYVVSPRSATGVCQSDGNPYGRNPWFSGNWLNYITTSRMDAVKKILYGGTRSTDTESETYLSGSYVPQDSTVWGTELRSDDTWMQTPLNAYFDITKYTPFAKPVSGASHFFARGSDLSKADRFPALRAAFNVKKDSFNIGGYDGVSEKVVMTDPNGHYWDWALVNRPLPDDLVFKTDFRKTLKIYQVRVKVCEKNNFSESEGCVAYESGYLKPGGLLQKYGGGSNPMYFGLLTGSYGPNITTEGGKLRNHIGPVYGVLPKDLTNSYVPALDSATGQALKNGLIKNIDNLAISGRNRSSSPAEWAGAGYVNTYAWYNPVGEMVYEAVRYLAGASAPTPAYSREADTDVAGSPILSLTAFNSGTKSWEARRPSIQASSCYMPVILLISDITADYDGNQFLSDVNKPLVSTKLSEKIKTSDVPNVFNLTTYLKTISNLEGFGTVNSEKKYYFSKGGTDTCAPKVLSGGLGEVKGMCPNGMSTQGTYSAAAAAYYGHIHDFYPANSEGTSYPQGIEVYAVAMGAAFPELSFPVRSATGDLSKSITVLPVNISAIVSGSPIMGFLNYFVLEWDVDRNGMVFHAKIKVNFSDADKGDDWEGDGQVYYTIDLLTDSSTPASMRETTAKTSDAGDANVKKLTYYAFKNPANANKTSDFIDISPSQVKAFRIHSEYYTTGTGAGMGMGYVMSGSTRDGVYLDITMNNPPASSNLTPKDCQYPGASTLGTYGCTKRVQNVKALSRVFAFNSSATEVEALPNPLWLAAKYGGFSDDNKNGVPDEGEWEGSDGNPRNYFQATNLAELPSKLEAAFKTIAKNISTGTATSAAVNSILGGGISIHTAYYPEYIDPTDDANRLTWTGTVYGLFVDKWGNLREDSNEDYKLQIKGENGGDSDRIVTFTSVSNPPSIPPLCYTAGNAITRCSDPYGLNIPQSLPGSEGNPANVHKLKSVWDFGRWLSELDPTGREILKGSRPYGVPARKADGRRLIYYGFKKAADGSAIRGVPPLFNTTGTDFSNLKKYLINSNFKDHLPMPLAYRPAEYTADNLAKSLVEFVTGVHIYGWRNRTVTNPWSNSPSTVVWRLGDIINSKPIISGSPGFSYDFLYGDASYATYKSKYGSRRQVAYFGSNDGIFHAINLGYYGSLKDGSVGYDPSAGGGAAHELGSELWAYIPASVLPHLKWLASPSYSHSYYVDMVPAIHDVLIKGEWRTILIGGLRLGGRPIHNPAAGGANEPNFFFSEFFCFDVTNPEEEPQLLWRFSAEDLGLSVGMPTVVRSGNKWYAVLASGPQTDYISAAGSLVYGDKDPYDGYSTKNAKIMVLDVESGDLAREPLEVPEADSFFGDPFVPIAKSDGSGSWNNHVIYYGLTVSRENQTCLDKGAVYRVQMASADGSPLPVKDWALKRMIGVDKPVTGAANSTYDIDGNLWVIFGTGRLWGLEDLSPCQNSTATAACKTNHEQYLYGVKESLNADGRLTFDDLTPKMNSLTDVTGAQVWASGMVTNLSFGSSPSMSYRSLSKILRQDGTLGYKRKFDMGKILFPNQPHDFEVLFTQPKIAGLGGGQSVQSFTTFQPNAVATYCGGLGHSFMYLLDTFTGLPMATKEMYSVFTSAEAGGNVSDPAAQLVTGGIYTGTEKDSESNFYRAEGRLIARASSGDNGIYDLEMESNDSFGSYPISWREVLNSGFEVSKEVMVKELGD